MDLIDRQAAIDAIADYLSYSTYTSSTSYLSTGALILSNVPSVQPEEDTLASVDSDAEFWENRAAEYSKIIASLVTDMGKGINFESMQITETGKIIFGKNEKDMRVIAEPVRKGKWVRNIHDKIICNQCGMFGNNEWNLCPNCGADMRYSDD